MLQGYFLVVSLPSLLQVSKHCAETNKSFLFNISAGYVCESFKDSVHQLLPYVDVIFGNDQEFTAFSSAFGLEVRSALTSMIGSCIRVLWANSSA